jgi:hypothetical protein
MQFHRHVAAAIAATLWLALAAATASAAFPNFSDCPRTAPGVAACIDIQNVSGNLNIKGFNVPLGESLEIRGGLSTPENGLVFTPPRGTTGFFARPVPVPGGLLGINFPIPGNTVLATTELAGSPTDIHINTINQSIRIPIRVHLSNLLLGMDCRIGTNSNPVVLTLITETTNPPPPNRPISGHVGEFEFNEETGALVIRGNLNVENSFAIPGATSCGLGLGLINALVNAKLRLPSAAGNNSIEVVNNVGLIGLGEE